MIHGAYYTFAEAANRLGVTVARVHVLAKTYGLQITKVNGRFSLIPKEELKKIPNKKERQRLTGKRIDHR